MREIELIKQNYGQQAESIIAAGLNLTRIGKKYRCPNVYAHKNADRNPSMSWDDNLLQFHCFGCGMNIDIYGYYREHLNYSHNEVLRELLGEEHISCNSLKKNRDEFVVEAKKVEALSEECMRYISLRGISKKTAENYGLGTYKGKIAFPYYKYETVIGYKLRLPMKNPPKPKMTSITGSKPYFFNAHRVDEKEVLIICEGEFDCMVIEQCGFPNVVSVGAGANSLSALIEQAKDFLKKFPQLIICSDNDESGQNMDKIFLEMMGDKVRLIDKTLYERNDVNEELIINGEEKVKEIIQSAFFKIEGRRDLDKTPYRGLRIREGNYIPTGMTKIDETLNDLAPGLVTLLAGRASAGKTTLVKQIVANAIDKGNKVYLMNGENDIDMLLNEFYTLIIGREKEKYRWVRVNKKMKKEPTEKELEKLRKWHEKKLVVFNKGESKLKTPKQLLEMLETEVKVNRFNLVVVDNLMSILSVQASDKNEVQADFMQGLCSIAQNNKCHIILVLHPNKTYRKGEDMEFEQISGTSDLYNKADNVLSIIRLYDEVSIVAGITGKLSILKNRYEGELASSELCYDKETGLLLEVVGGVAKGFGFKYNQEPTQLDIFGVEEVDDDCPF